MTSRKRSGRTAGTLSVYREVIPEAVLSEADKIGMAMHALAHRADLYDLTVAAVRATDPFQNISFEKRMDQHFRARFLIGAFGHRLPEMRKVIWNRFEADAQDTIEILHRDLRNRAQEYVDAKALVERPRATLARNKEWVASNMLAVATIPLLGLPVWMATMAVLGPASFVVHNKIPKNRMKLPPVPVSEPLHGVHRWRHHIEAAVTYLALGDVLNAFQDILFAEEDLGREMAAHRLYDEQLGVKALALREVEKAFLRSTTFKSWLAKKLGYASGKR